MKSLLLPLFGLSILYQANCFSQSANVSGKSGLIDKSLSISGIEWQMHPKFLPDQPFNNQSNKVVGYLRFSHRYDPEYVKAENYGITITANVNTGLIKHPVKYKWEIIGIMKGDRSANSYYKQYVTDRKGLWTGSSISNDINPTHYEIEKLPFDGLYKINITPIIMNNEFGTPQATYESVIQLKDLLIIALGDSFTSGEGNPDVYGVTDDENWCENVTLGEGANQIFNTEFDMKIDPVWLEPLAHRSLKSPSALLAKKLEEEDKRSVITFLNLGVSGAKILKGLIYAQQPAWQSSGQIDEAKRAINGRQVHGVYISIGINDIGGPGGGISSLIATAAYPFSDFNDNESAKNAFEELENLDALYERLNSEIRSKLNPKNIFLYEVPINIFRNSDGKIESGCGALRNISVDDAVVLDRIGTELNLRINLACEKNQWTYIDNVVSAFKGHGYCATSANSWYRAATTSCKIQGDINGTIHPNENGHKKIASIAFEKTWRKIRNSISIIAPGVSGRK